MKITAFQPVQVRRQILAYDESHLNWDGKIDDSERKLLPRAYQNLQVSDETLSRGHAVLRNTLESALQKPGQVSREELNQSLLEGEVNSQQSASVGQKNAKAKMLRSRLGTGLSLAGGVALSALGPAGMAAGLATAAAGSAWALKDPYVAAPAGLGTLGLMGVLHGLSGTSIVPLWVSAGIGLIGLVPLAAAVTMASSDSREAGARVEAQAFRTARETLLPAWESDLRDHPNRQQALDSLGKRGLSPDKANPLLDQAERVKGLCAEEGYDALLLLAGSYGKAGDISQHFEKFADLVEGGLSGDLAHTLLRGSLQSCEDPREARTCLETIAGVPGPLAEGVLRWTGRGAVWPEASSLAASATVRAQAVSLEARTQEVLSYPGSIWPHHLYTQSSEPVPAYVQNEPGIPNRRGLDMERQVFTPPYLWDVEATALESGFSLESSRGYAAAFGRDIQKTYGNEIVDTLRQPDIQARGELACRSIQRVAGADPRLLGAMNEVMQSYRTEQTLEAFTLLHEKLDPEERVSVAILFRDSLLNAKGGRKVSPAVVADGLVRLIESGKDSQDALTAVQRLLLDCRSADDPNQAFQDQLASATPKE